MLSQRCTVLGATPPSPRLHRPVLFKQKQLFPESNGSRNFEGNTEHGYGTIITTATMSDNTGSSNNINNDNDNENANTMRTLELSRARAREQRKERRRILAKVKEDVSSRIKEEDLRKIFSVPLEKRDRATSTVNDPEIVWEYVPREQDGLIIDLMTASCILWGVTYRALHERLRKIDGYAWASKVKQPDGIWRYVVCYWRGEGFSLPDFLKDLPFITTSEETRPPPGGGFRLETSPPIEPGSKLYPWSNSSFSLPGVSLTDFGTVGFVGILDRGINSAKIHVLVTVGHVLDNKDPSSCGIETDVDDPMQVVQLHLIDEFRRELDDDGKRRLRFREGCPYNPCLNEICLISPNGLPEGLLLNCQFQLPINCNLFFADFLGQDTTPDHNVNTTHYPGVLDDVDLLIESLERFMPLTVYKNGAKTGLTTGKLYKFRPYSACNTRRTDTKNLSKADDFLCMVVKWDSPSECFSDDGDSGSLVYAIRDGQMVPLGIHFGSNSDELESYSYLLWYWCDALETSLDAELFFCNFCRS